MSPMSRRAFLGRGLATGAGVAVGAGVEVADASSPAGASSWRASSFHGVHQAGVLDKESPVASFLFFDVVAESRGELVDLLKTITDRARLLTSGGAPENLGPAVPPDDNGILGPTIPRHELVVTLGMGSSLFDDRFGLKARKPARIKPMKTFPNDNLDYSQSHGDLSVQLRATDTDTVIHAMRDLTKHTRGGMQPRWRIDGVHAVPRPSGTPRNYLGFRDGIANPEVTEASVANQLIWAERGVPEPAWTAGGTYQVIRVIRMLVEFWDRVSLQEQETMIGRRRDSGAPLDGNNQNDLPNYKADPGGRIIPLTAHMRLANPRTPQTADSLILRRGFNYDRGIDLNGNLDQGLIFTCYQQNIERQFEATQTRLIDEPLVDYISPTGGGYFFVPAGVRDSTDWYASALFT
jgi:deferrochelatase/peroxidase EfeB